MSERWRTREHATNVRPALNSFFPMSITTLSRVSPWALCIVTAQASLRGICSREHALPPCIQVRRWGTIGRLPSCKVGPQYLLNLTITAKGRLGGPPLWWQMAWTVPIAPFTRPASVHRLDVSITLAPRARQMTGSSPEASSEDALLALGPVWTALMVAIGSPALRSLATLYSATACTVGCKWRASSKAALSTRERHCVIKSSQSASPFLKWRSSSRNLTCSLSYPSCRKTSVNTTALANNWYVVCPRSAMADLGTEE